MEQKIKGKQSMADKPYPWTCGQCAQKTIEPVVKDYQIAFKHDGKLHQITLPQVEVPTCRNCGTEHTDIQISRQVTSELRRKIGLMFPDEIKRQRTALKLSQEQLGECIGAAKESISRWENGVLIQSVSTDKLLRMFFKHPSDPNWNNKWLKPSEPIVVQVPEFSSQNWILSASRTNANTGRSSGIWQEILESVERRLLSRLMVDDTLFPVVEARLTEDDFQNALMRCTYHSMRSVFHETGRIDPRRLAQILAAQASELPADPEEIVILLVDTAVPITEFNELLDLMSRRSQVRRELTKSF
jgi:putative zinc finger/helix-turn-helix YgiT family protein